MTFDEILADCIQALEQGATIRECLTRYPAQATALEPLLQLVVSLSRESQTRLSAPAFRRGRQALATQAQQHHAHHRQPSAPTPASRYAVQPAVYTQNGLPHHRQIRRLATQKRAGGSWGMPRLLRTALLLLLLLGGTTFFRQVMTSLPGTTFYPVKSTGGQLVEVLMEAAGEGPSWHAMQAERRLQELAQLTNPDTTTVQSLSTVVETHWAAMLTASEGLPTTEREALLQTQITHLRQLEAAWTLPQADTPPPAVATVRKLIATGEAALSQPTDTPTAGVETAPVTPTRLSTVAPPLTPTPLLQASATAALPVLVPSLTPTASPTPVATQVDLATPTVELPSPTAPISEPPTTTPLPQITVQMPQQETNDQQADEDHKDTDKPTETATATATAPSEPPTATPTVSPTNLTTPDVEEGTATIAPTVITATPPPLTPVPTEAQLTPVSATQTPQETATSENTPAVPTKTAPLATATAVPTSEPSATSTIRPTAQATATRTPKPTATQASPPTATAEATDATAAPTPAVENTPAPTGQPTTPPRDEALQTPSSAAVTPVFSPPVKPRPTTPGGEPTKEVQP